VGVKQEGLARMGHIGHLKEEYAALVERLEGGPIAFPRPRNPVAEAGWAEILEVLYSPEEARLATRLPVLPSSLAKVAARFGLSEAETLSKLEAMADHGLVYDLLDPRTGRFSYMLAPPVIGFVEFSLMRAAGQDGVPKQRIARALDAYMRGDDTFAREVFGGETVIGRALAREETLHGERLPDVLPWERASSLIADASRISVSLCYCRHKAEHLGKRCEAPMENCFSLNGGAEFVIRRGFGRELDRGEALEIIAASREAGLVHIADNVLEAPTYICNCCPCCCEQLHAINVYGLRAVNPSGFEPALEDASCTGCGKCAKACPIGAIDLEAVPADGERRDRKRPRVDRERCIGCGLCAEACKPNALEMVRGTAPPRIPRTISERVLRMAIERGHLPHLIFDQGAGRGQRFLNQLLQRLCALPPVQRILASEQLKSRFIRFVLGTLGESS
jgi:ferredoxin